ncbi:MAG: ParB/RepB/Spo0J family partition protein [Clostridiales bacterium]
MTTKKGLGKGLSALLNENNTLEINNEEKIVNLSLDQIKANPLQPRKDFDEDKLTELAVSLKEYGLLQPIIVVEKGSSLIGGSFYEIVAGERRWRAAKVAGLENIPCIIRKLSPGEIMELSLIENIQREDLNPLEEAHTYRQLMDTFNYTQEDLASKLGKSRSHLANTLRLLNLQPAFQDMLRDGLITAGHARALLMVDDPANRKLLAKKIVNEKISVRQAEDFARIVNGQTENAKESKNPKTPAINDFLKELENRLRQKISTQVKIKTTGKGGQIILEYYSDEDLQRILDDLLPGEEF